MKKKIYPIWSLALISSLIGVETAHADWLVTKFSQDVTTDGKVESKTPVCYTFVTASGSSSTKTYYTSLDKALTKANSSSTADTIVVIPGSTCTLSYNAKVSSNDRLVLPIVDGALDVRGTASTSEDTKTYINPMTHVGEGMDVFPDSSHANVTTYRKSLIIIKSGKKLTVEGKIDIGGKFGASKNNSYQRPTGFTNGDYCEIQLEANAVIDVKGTMNNYGFIKETATDNGSQLNFYNSSVGTMPFTIYDYGGGSDTAGKYSKGISPFSIYDFPNTHVETTYNYGSKLIGAADLVTAKSLIDQSITHHNTGINIIGTSDSLLNITIAGSYVKAKYHSKDPLYTTNILTNTSKSTKDSNGNIDGSVTLTLNGAITIDSLTMNCAGNNVDMSTLLFPLCWKYSIYYLSGNLNVNTMLEFKSGSSVSVSSGAVVNLNAKCMFYPDFAPSPGYIAAYPSTMGKAILTNNGTVNINANFGGRIETTAEEAILTFGSGSVDSAVSTFDGKGEKMGMKWTTIDTISTDANGVIYDESTSAAAESTFTSGVAYISKGTYWEKSNIAVHSLSFAVQSNGSDDYADADFEYSLKTTYNGKTNEQRITNNNHGSITVFEGTTYEITAITGGKSITSTSGTVNSDTTVTIVCKQGVRLYTFSASYNDNNDDNDDKEETPEFDLTIKNGDTVVDRKHMTSSNSSFKIVKGYSVTITRTTTKGNDEKEYVGTSTSGTDITGSLADGYTFDDISSNISIYIVYDGTATCFVEGTLITMADGSFRKIEELKPGELILSYDFETGKYISTPAAEVTNHGENVYNVLRLHFDDESSIGIIQGHGFFDVTLKKYVDIDENNYKQYIGHEFMRCIDGKTTIAKLVTGEISAEKTCSYSLLAAVTINSIADGFVTITPPITDWYNMFEVGDDLKWDEEKKREDIEKYGLFEYDEVKDIIPYEIFVASNFKYFKVAFAKGLLTMEDVKRFLEWYRSLERNGEIKLGI